MHHLCYEPRELVIVGKHQLCQADGVVLIDDGYHPVVEHHLHAGLLIAEVFFGLEVALHRQYLSDVESVFAE